ncbi:MAG TPA: response regulator transcription factor [Labilithrix sp.]|nr:response regulator transcription factor [Labilithrix sp.]
MRIVLIDDHGLVRAGARTILESAIVGAEVKEMDSLQDALSSNEEPAVVILDVCLQGVSGVVGLELLSKKWPRVPVIMLSAHADPNTVKDALARGAMAFVSKAEPVTRLVEAVNRAVSEPSSVQATSMTSLSERQLAVLDLLAQGLSNKAVAARLHLSEFTVRGHVQALFAALDVSSRSEAVFVARSRGLIR